MKRNALPPPVGRLDPDPPAVRLDDAPAHRQPDPRAVDLLVRAREHAEDPARLGGVDAEAVVAHRHDPFLAVGDRRDVDPQRRVAAELHRVREQVLQHAPQLPRVALDLRQLADLERRARLVEPTVEVLGDLGHELAEPDRLAAQLAGARVDEHAVDEVARSLRARPQLPQDGGRRRLRSAALEQSDEHRDARDRLAQVVRHDVGVVAQLRLHAPVLGDVGEEVDEPVAELGGAVHERAQHVAVAERHVVRHLGDPRHARLAHLDVVVERAAVAHPRERLEQRVAVARRGRDAEGVQHRGIPVAEREVDDPPAVVAQRPEHADRFREAVEERAELGRSLHAEQLDQLRIVAPGLGLRGGIAFGHVRRIGRCH